MVSGWHEAVDNVRSSECRLHNFSVGIVDDSEGLSLDASTG